MVYLGNYIENHLNILDFLLILRTMKGAITVDESRYIKFTQVAIDRLAPRNKGREIIWDALLPGLGVRVSPPHPRSGRIRKTFVALYRVNGKLVQETFGEVGLFPNLDEVRELARESMRKAQRGINVALERRLEKQKRRGARRSSEEIASTKDPDTLLPRVVARFMDQYKDGEGGTNRRAGTIEMVERDLNRLATWQPHTIIRGVQINDGPNWSTLSIGELTRDAIRDYHKKIGAAGHTVAANVPCDM